MICLRALLREISIAAYGRWKFSDAAYLIFVDNQAVKDLSHEPKVTDMSKHWLMCFKWIRQCQNLGYFRIAWVQGKANCADLLTKPQGPTAHREWATRLHKSEWIGNHLLEVIRKHLPCTTPRLATNERPTNWPIEDD